MVAARLWLSLANAFSANLGLYQESCARNVAVVFTSKLRRGSVSEQYVDDVVTLWKELNASQAGAAFFARQFVRVARYMWSGQREDCLSVVRQVAEAFSGKSVVRHQIEMIVKTWYEDAAHEKKDEVMEQLYPLVCDLTEAREENF